MRFNLARLAKRRSRRPITLPPMQPTKAQSEGLARLYLTVVREWRAGVPLILASYERTLGEMVTDAPDDTRSAIDGIAAAINRLVLMLTPDLRDWAFRVEEVHRGKWVRSILSAVDIELDTILSAADVVETVETTIEWNVSLIRDVSEEIRRKIANTVFSGFQQRKPAREVAKEIRESVGMARARSLRIAADQTVKLGERLNQARQEQAGLEQFKWRHSGKLHPREHHVARDGKVYRWSDPALKGDLPGAAPFCGCTGQAVVVFEDD